MACLIQRSGEGLMATISKNFFWRLTTWTMATYGAAAMATLAFGVEAAQLG